MPRSLFLPAIPAVIACAFLYVPVSASLDFNTYRIVKTTDRILEDGEYRDSVSITYELTRLGSTSLEASSITLTSHGSYLSVVEEATLTGNVENRPRGITQDFLFQGSLPIPPLAAVHSLSVMHGDTLFRAGLRKSVYSLNDVFFDTLALQATLNGRVAFLQQLTDVSFEATFSKLALGEPLRIRIEYDLPFPGAPGTPIRIPVLFHPSGAPPRQAQITFFEETRDLPPVQLLSASGRVTLNDSGTHTLPYQSEFLFRRDEEAGTMTTLQTTAFESGKLQGQYLLFKGGLNDSLMNLLSRPMEVSFLWRWNPPYKFVELQNGLKTLSPLGRLAVDEAGALKRLILEFTPRGHRFGLLFNAPGKQEVFFAPSEEGDGDYAKLLEYLDQFTDQRIYADYKDYQEETPAWATSAWTDSGEAVKSRRQFLDALKRIGEGFSARPEALKHIALIGVGYAPPGILDLQDPEAIEAVLDSVTVSNVNASWPGVDLTQVLRMKANENLRPLVVNSPLAAGLQPLMFPVFQPTSVEYRAFSPARSHAVVLPFGLGSEREALFKASGPFADTLQLQGIDALGRKTRVFTLHPRTLGADADSGLARLWAADPDRIAEVSEVDLGMRYGILTKGTYLAAGVGEGVQVQGNGTPPGTPVLPKSVRVGVRRTFFTQGGFLHIADPGKLPDQGRGLALDIFDLRGRLVMKLPLSRFRRGDGYAVPLEYLRRFGQVRLFLVLRGADRVHSFALNLGVRP